jgi:hypothetical protein
VGLLAVTQPARTATTKDKTMRGRAGPARRHDPLLPFTSAPFSSTRARPFQPGLPVPPGERPILADFTRDPAQEAATKAGVVFPVREREPQGLWTLRPDGRDRRMIPLPRGYLHKHPNFFPEDGSSGQAQIIFAAKIDPNLS